MLDDRRFLAAGTGAAVKLPLMQHFLCEATVPQVDDKLGSE